MDQKTQTITLGETEIYLPKIFGELNIEYSPNVPFASDADKETIIPARTDYITKCDK